MSADGQSPGPLVGFEPETRIIPLEAILPLKAMRLASTWVALDALAIRTPCPPLPRLAHVPAHNAGMPLRCDHPYPCRRRSALRPIRNICIFRLIPINRFAYTIPFRRQPP